MEKKACMGEKSSSGLGSLKGDGENVKQQQQQQKEKCHDESYDR
jgi:hypothetical protein